VQALKAAKKDAAAAKEAATAAAIEDVSWEEGAKKGNKKTAAKAESAAAKADRKAVAEQQAAEEEASLSRPTSAKGKKAGSGGSKVSRAEIAARIMKEQEAKAKAEAKAKKEVARTGGTDYMGALLENDNKSDAISASGIENAIGALDIASSSDAAKGRGGPARVNVKAAYAAFEEAELPRLKEENPGLKHAQYQERLNKLWARHPDNPHNAT